MRQKKSPRNFFTARFCLRIARQLLRLRLLRIRSLLTLRSQLSELLGRKNSFRLFQECLPAFLRAAGLHTFGLPRFDFCLLIGREIKCCQIDARHSVRFRRALGATCVISCKRAGCR